MKYTLGVLFALAGIVVFVAMAPEEVNNPGRFHSEQELSFYRKALNINASALIDSDAYFLHPSECRGCHGYDSLHIANIDGQGNDINLYDDWETSMMGLSGVDPFWKAKVSQEITINPAHANDLQLLCTRCHAPMGHFTAMLHGQGTYTLEDLAHDSLGQAGVACGGCHSIQSDSISGLEFTGNLHYDTTHVEFGPFTNPTQGPMQLYVGLLPVYSTHMGRSQLCATCHTLISNVVDLNGIPTGNTFVEQATYHEWKNSVYPAQDKVCQSCHMPQVEDPVKIANGYISLIGRTPFNLHEFAGANTFMLQLMKNNKDSLGITASDRNFDSTFSATSRLLRTNTVSIQVDSINVSPDTAYFDVKLTNKAGHKFPSGYPSRRAVLQFVVMKEGGDTLFASGLFDANNEVVGLDSPFERHHDIIKQPNEVQVYEMVMGDVNNNKTTILERSNSKLKDNRLVPKGFTTSHSAYDTCFIKGDAEVDPDFNRVNGLQGSGNDVVHYHIPLNGYAGRVSISASVYYQSIPPAFLNEMRSLSTSHIDRFLGMYDAADKRPFLVTADTLKEFIIPQAPLPNAVNWGMPLQGFELSPNPTRDGFVELKGPLLAGTRLSIYSSSFALVSTFQIAEPLRERMLELPPSPGFYFLVIEQNKQRRLIKIVRL